jgi:DNA-binding NarL/FixJ family response regulator
MYKTRGRGHPSNEPITVLIADEEPVVVESLRRLLAGDDRFRVVAAASSAEEAVALCLRERPDVALVDIDPSKVDGVETTRRLRQLQPELRIVAMGASQGTETIGPAIDAGASGYLPKAHASSVLASTIERVAAGAMVLSDEGVTQGIAPGIERPLRRQPADVALLARLLTARELEVLELVARGRSTREIAETLGITLLTAQSHVKKILLKLGVHSRLEAVSFAIRYKLIRMAD